MIASDTCARLQTHALLLLIAVPIIMLDILSITLAEPRVDYLCALESSCPQAGPRICGFDKENVCFRHFPSECHMEIYVCDHEREFIKYSEGFCHLVGFMCHEEYKLYSDNYAKTENLDDIILSIYRKDN